MRFNKITGFPAQDTAVGFYRVIQPLRFLKREGIAKEARTLPFTGDSQTQHYQWSDKTYLEICAGSEAVISTLLWKQADILRLLNLRHHFGLKTIVDLDDNIWASGADNPATDHAAALMPNRELCLSLADGVTVSVPALKPLAERLNPNVFVKPNGIDFKPWDALRAPGKRALRIGWRGALGHREDLDLVRPVVKKLKAAYPNLVFVTFGWKPDFSDEHHPYVSFQKYPEGLAALGVDIALVPLIDSAYNRCKSNLGWLEWSALSVPSCYSPTENHKGLPGLACSTPYEWYENVSSLLDDPKLRRKTGAEQNAFAKRRFSESALVYDLAAWIAALPRRTDLEP